MISTSTSQRHTHPEIWVCERPASLAHSAADSVIDEGGVVPDESHDKLALVLVGNGGGFEDGIQYTGAGDVVCHLDEFVHPESL